MAAASYTPPNDGTEIRARHIRQLWQAISAQLNGNLDAANFANGAIDYAKLSIADGSIASTKMQNSGDLELFRRDMAINLVASGCVWANLTGLSGTMTAGVVYVNGIRKSVATVASNTFTASRDTYVDVDSTGAVGYSAVTNGASAPALSSNSVRVAKIITNGTTIASIVQTGYDSQNNRIYPNKINNGESMWYEEIGRAVGTNTSTLSIPVLPARKYLRIILRLNAGGSTFTGIMRFNGDTAGNYHVRASDNGGADTTATGSTGIGGIDTGSVISNPVYAVFDVTNIATEEKVLIGFITRNQAGANAPSRREIFNKWSNTSNQITSLIVGIGSGTATAFGTDSEVIVLGHN